MVKVSLLVNVFLSLLVSFLDSASRCSLIVKTGPGINIDISIVSGVSICVSTCTDMIFVKKFTRPQFWEEEFYAKKCVNRNISQFATKQRKWSKMA